MPQGQLSILAIEHTERRIRKANQSQLVHIYLLIANWMHEDELMNWKAIIENHLDSPIAKTIAFVSSSIVAAVLAGTFVTEITVNNALDWKLFYRTWSFYGLVLQSLGVYAYNRFIFTRDRQIERFAEAEYCKAYVMSKCLPELAERYAQNIRNGETGDLKCAMDVLKESLQ